MGKCCSSEELMLTFYNFLKRVTFELFTVFRVAQNVVSTSCERAEKETLR